MNNDRLKILICDHHSDDHISALSLAVQEKLAQKGINEVIVIKTKADFDNIADVPQDAILLIENIEDFVTEFSVRELSDFSKRFMFGPSAGSEQAHKELIEKQFLLAQHDVKYIPPRITKPSFDDMHHTSHKRDRQVQQRMAAKRRNK